MLLVLIRHAVAFERDSRRWPDDRKRPLRPEGARKFRSAAKGIRRVLPHVDKVLSSGLVRADETAAILADIAGWPTAEPLPELAPPESAESVFKALQGRFTAKKRPKSLALVGHEPQVARLLAASISRTEGSADTTAVEFRKGGIAVIEFEGVPKAGRRDAHLVRAARGGAGDQTKESAPGLSPRARTASTLRAIPRGERTACMSARSAYIEHAALWHHPVFRGHRRDCSGTRA